MNPPEDPRWDTTARLVGRERELEFLRVFAANSAAVGGSLLVVGEAGVGKTVLLDASAAHAASAGTRVLRAAGVEFEADISFAGLHQVLFPLTDELQGLSSTYRKALGVGLGLEEGPTPDQLTLANAAIALLTQASAVDALLVVVDDVQWLDRASAVLLGVIARRLEGSRVGLLGALRIGEGSFFEAGGLGEITIGPLDNDAASTLLVENFPDLVPRARQRVLAEAQGNPLALVELPRATITYGPTLESVPARAPVSRRLQAHFARRISGLSARTRHQLLLAALEGSGDPSASPSAFIGRFSDLASAQQARLVRLDPVARRVEFRHPLTRAAIVELSSDEQLREAHLILANMNPLNSERRAWHLSEATVEPDENVAGLLEQAASNIQRRGDPVGAITMLLRAAALSPSTQDKSRRAMLATYLGVDITGDMAEARELLDQSGPGESLAATAAATAYMINAGGDTDTIHRLLVEAIRGSDDPTNAQDHTLVEIMWLLQANTVFGSRRGLAEDFQAALNRLQPEPPEILRLLGSTFVEPTRLALPSLPLLDSSIAGIGDETDPAYAVRLAIAATYVDRMAGCRNALWRAIEHGRAGGAITSAIEAFTLLGFEGLMMGDWDGVLKLAEEGLELTERHQYLLLSGFLRYDQALIAAARGDDETVTALTDDLTRWAAPSRIGYITQLAAHAKSLAALGRGDFDVAYHHALQVCSPGTVPAYVPNALWVILDLVEAAVRGGQMDEARAHVADISDSGIADISPRLAMITAGVTAMTATEKEYREAFDAALAVTDADRWPFHQARLQLAYGERLRRAKSVADARRHLNAALATFERLRAQPWINRASNELRASGQPVQPSAPTAFESLTPQQREIASLAAAGLTNKQIGQRLFLSPRTVATHLYQLFPKLGITSRAALRDALNQPPTSH